MAADIGADMGRSEFALHQLDGGKDGTLRTAGAERGRTRRQRSESRGGLCLVRDKAARLFGDCVGIDAIRFRVLKKGWKAFEQNVGRVFAYFWQRAFTKHTRNDAGAAQFQLDRLLDVVG